MVLPARENVVVDLLPTVCALVQFERLEVQRRTRTATAKMRRVYPGPLRQNPRELQLVVWWTPAGRHTRIQWIVRETNTSVLVPDVALMHQFGNTLRNVFAHRPPPSPPPPREMWLGPGETLRGPFNGQLYDYSGCAMIDEVAGLLEGDLPLGRWAFSRRKGDVRRGPKLYLPRNRPGTNELLINKGAFVCASAGAGKTKLLVRWAKAANRAGFSQLIVDVKGDLRAKLGALEGRIFHFSTDPAAGRGRPPSDRINLISGLSGCADGGKQQVSQIAEALMPQREFKGEEGNRYLSRKKWLGALIHLLQIYHYYDGRDSFEGRGPDLSDVYRATTDERYLCDIILKVRELEANRVRRNEPLLRIGEDFGAEFWVRELALLLDPKLIEGGQRAERDAFQAMTFGLPQELDAFSSASSIGKRIGDRGAGRLFRLEDLVGNRQTTIILEARVVDAGSAETVLSGIIAKLGYLIQNRFPEEPPRPLLLLLDEAARIRSFKPDEYFSFARSAKAGCVVVYQGINQVCGGDRGRLDTVLANVGVQIYLGSLEGDTAEYVSRRLGKRTRTIYEPVPGARPGSPRTIPRSIEVDNLSIRELGSLPAGRWPALVFVRDCSSKPILVDMSEPTSDHQQR